MNKDNRAGKVYNWLYNHENNLALLKFISDAGITPIEVFSMVSEMAFCSYKRLSKDKVDKDACETFESVIEYYYRMIQFDKSDTSEE